MKRRSIGAIAILAIASSVVLAADPAFADPEIAVEEIYDFSSPTDYRCGWSSYHQGDLR